MHEPGESARPGGVRARTFLPRSTPQRPGGLRAAGPGRSRTARRRPPRRQPTDRPRSAGSRVRAVLLIGLTGGIGSGKSTVSALLAAKGAVIIDADAITRELQQPGTEVFAAMVERFGAGILAADGTLDRQAVADLVFNDPDALEGPRRHRPPGGGRGDRPAARGRGRTRTTWWCSTSRCSWSRAATTWPRWWSSTSTPRSPSRRLVEQRGMREADVRARMASQVAARGAARQGRPRDRQLRHARRPRPPRSTSCGRACWPSEPAPSAAAPPGAPQPGRQPGAPHRGRRPPAVLGDVGAGRDLAPARQPAHGVVARRSSCWSSARARCCWRPGRVGAAGAARRRRRRHDVVGGARCSATTGSSPPSSTWRCSSRWRSGWSGAAGTTATDLADRLPPGRPAVPARLLLLRRRSPSSTRRSSTGR